MRYALVLAVLLFSTLCATRAQAATKTFDGGPSGSGADFSVAANWSGDTLPTASDELLFNGTSSASFITNVSGTYQRIFVPVLGISAHIGERLAREIDRRTELNVVILGKEDMCRQKHRRQKGI